MSKIFLTYTYDANDKVIKHTFKLYSNKTQKYYDESSHFLRRPRKLTKSSPSISPLLHSVKSTVKISSIFVAFLENMNFISVEVTHLGFFYSVQMGLLLLEFNDHT